MPLPVPELGDLQPGDEVTVEEIPHETTNHHNSFARHLALQALYEIDTTGHLPGAVIQQLLSTYHEQPSEAAVHHMQQIVTGVVHNKESIDAAIQPFAPEFPVRHLAVVDRNILRIAIYEYVLAKAVPMGVAIDEAVSLAKAFGADSSPRFVNGVLGNLMENADVIARLQAEMLQE
jgi:transcription antitermination protein NusB